MSFFVPILAPPRFSQASGHQTHHSQAYPLNQHDEEGVNETGNGNWMPFIWP